MKIIRAKDYYDMSRKAANIISAQVIMKPNCVLGLATGGTNCAPAAGPAGTAGDKTGPAAGTKTGGCNIRGYHPHQHH